MLERLNSLIDDDVTDVLIGSASGVWVQRGVRLARDDWVLTEAETRSLAVTLVDAGGRHIDDATPCVDVRLPGGVRVHAVLAPVSVGGTEISIRVPTRTPIRLESLLAGGVLTQGQATFLETAVKSKLTFLITGSAAAGKTTLLGALMSRVDEQERIVTIEDVAELRLEHPRVVTLETRQANVEGRGGIDIAELIRQSLRMRPDRLVVGECRGTEVIDMLRAFTTGHGGGGSTLHANSLEDVSVRLDSLGALAGLQSDFLSRLARTAIDVVIHVEADASGRRMKFGRLISEEGSLRVEEIEFLTATRHSL